MEDAEETKISESVLEMVKPVTCSNCREQF